MVITDVFASLLCGMQGVGCWIEHTHTYILDVFRSSVCCKELRAAQMNQALKTEGGERMHERRQKTDSEMPLFLLSLSLVSVKIFITLLEC